MQVVVVKFCYTDFLSVVYRHGKQSLLLQQIGIYL